MSLAAEAKTTVSVLPHAPRLGYGVRGVGPPCA